MRGFPAPQFVSILKSLHAFDELDKERIEAMQTVRSLQVLCGASSAAPPPPVVAQHMSYDELMREPPEGVRTQSLAEFLAEDEREDVVVLPDPGIVVDPRTRQTLVYDAYLARAQLEVHTTTAR